jgi:hypothetical protein
VRKITFFHTLTGVHADAGIYQSTKRRMTKKVSGVLLVLQIRTGRSTGRITFLHALTVCTYGRRRAQ